MHSKKLIDLELDFAVRASELLNISIEESLLKYTGLYGALVVPSPSKDEKQEIWINYLNHIKGKNLKTSTYEFYINRTKERDRYQKKIIYSGKPCFIYHTENDQAYLHFNNNEGAEPGPLSKASMAARLKELRDISTDLKTNHPEVKSINGYSWIYNIEAYTRLFPKEFLEHKTEIHDDFGFNIYGQFLDSSESLKKEISEKFLNDVNNASSFDELVNAFPYYPIKVSLYMDKFYDFYIDN